MLKPKGKYYYKEERFGIINPSEELKEEIIKYLSAFENGDGEIDFDNMAVTRYLFETLIESDDVDFKFKEYSDVEFEAVYLDPPEIFNEVAYIIGGLVTDILVENLRKASMNIKKIRLEVAQLDSIEEVNKLYEQYTALDKANKLEKNKEKVAEKRDNAIKSGKIKLPKVPEVPDEELNNYIKSVLGSDEVNGKG